MVTAIPALIMIPVRWPVRAPRDGRRSRSAALPTTTAVPTEAPCRIRATKSAATPSAVMKTTSPAIMPTAAPSSSGLRPYLSDACPAIRTAASAATAYAAKTSVVVSGARSQRCS